MLILYNLLRKWSEYTNVLKMPATVVRDILQGKEVSKQKKKLIRKQEDEDNRVASLKD